MTVSPTGNLVYVMGPSGAGKDTVLGAARTYVQSAPAYAEHAIMFAHRYITRPHTSGGENHVALSEYEFSQRERAGLFALQWESHGNRYGIGIEINAALTHGMTVVLNGSRAYLPVALTLYPLMQPVLVTAPEHLIAERLCCRGREDSEAISARLHRNSCLEAERHTAGSAIPAQNSKPVHVVCNDTTVSAAVEQFVAVLV